MGFSGTLETLGFTEILQWCKNGRKTGTLTVGRTGIKKEIYFEDGKIVSAGSNDPREYLGHYLIGLGRITEEQLRHAMATQRKTCVLLGKILALRGLLTEEDLAAVLREKIMATIFNVFLWQTGKFHFASRPLSEKDRRVDVALDIDRCIFDGIEMMERWKRCRAVFPDDRMVISPGAKTPPAGLRTGVPGRIIELAREGRSIAALRLETHLSTTALLDALYGLHQRQFITAAFPKTPGRAPQPAAPAGAFRSEGSELRHLAERALPPQAVPELSADLATLAATAFSPEEGFVLSRINGEWSVGDILTAAPLLELEVLRILKKFLDAGTITLLPPG